jgi:hypothetical protein
MTAAFTKGNLRQGVLMEYDREYGPAISKVREYYDGPIRPYMSIEYGRKSKNEAISLVDIHLHSSVKNPYQLVAILQEELPNQYIAFQGNRSWLGEEQHSGAEIVIAIANSQLEALRLAESRGVNQDVSTERVVEVLTNYDRQYGIRIVQAGKDSVEFKLLKLPADIDKFLEGMAKSLVVPTHPRKDIIAQINKTKLVGLWWD